MNTYTLKLKPQETLNAEYVGYFKTAAFDCGHRYAAYWLRAGVLTEGEISRMGEAALTADLLVTLMDKVQSNKAVYRTRFLGHKFVSCGGPE